ncbi:DUF371 domain-containing protein [Candidatus Woesearchaeota archaeon]|nr:DUF371 domain-containing protein [Candidatus Woesearchaeota archaeon]
MKFTCSGHPNILGKHRNTIEFTKDPKVSLQGDCIVGVGCDFEFRNMKEMIEKNDEIIVDVIVGNQKFSFSSKINKTFTDDHEMVFRRGEFASSRTLGVRTDKAAMDIPRSMMEKMKDPKQKMTVEIIGRKK